MKWTLLILIILTVGGGIGLRAQKALPGESLYPVKIQIENALLKVSIKPEWQIFFAERWATRRVREVVTIVAQEKSDARVIIDAHAKIIVTLLQKAHASLTTLADRSLGRAMIAAFMLETRASLLQSSLAETRNKIDNAELNLSLDPIFASLYEIQSAAGAVFEDLERRAEPDVLRKNVSSLLKFAQQMKAAVAAKQARFDARGRVLPDDASSTLANAERKIRETEELIRLGQYHGAFATIREALRAFIIFDFRFDLSDIRKAFEKESEPVTAPQAPLAEPPAKEKIVVPGVDESGTLTLPPPDAQGNIEVPLEDGRILKFKTEPVQ